MYDAFTDINQKDKCFSVSNTALKNNKSNDYGEEVENGKKFTATDYQAQLVNEYRDEQSYILSSQIETEPIIHGSDRGLCLGNA